MSATYLIVSNPPHRDIDPQVIADAFGFTAAEARMRLNFPAPEIWFADGDVAALKQTGEVLMKGGANLRIIKGSMLAAIPTADLLVSFAFEGDRFVAQCKGAGEFTAAYDARLYIVSSRPRANPTLGIDRPKPQLGHISSRQLRDRFGVMGIVSDETPRNAEIDATGAHDAMDPWFLDLFFIIQSAVTRIRAWAGSVDYSGLGPSRQPLAKQNQAALANELKTRFARAVFDDRLEDMPVPKPSAISGKGLPALLESIDASLKGVSVGDVQSRLAFLSRL